MSTNASFEGTRTIMVVLVLRAGLFRSGWVPFRWVGVAEIAERAHADSYGAEKPKVTDQHLKCWIGTVRFRTRGGLPPRGRHIMHHRSPQGWRQQW